MTKMEWLYTHTSEITREDMEEVKVELEELAKTRELSCSEQDILKMARSKEKIGIVQHLIAGGL